MGGTLSSGSGDDENKQDAPQAVDSPPPSPTSAPRRPIAAGVEMLGVKAPAQQPRASYAGSSAFGSFASGQSMHSILVSGRPTHQIGGHDSGGSSYGLSTVLRTRYADPFDYIHTLLPPPIPFSKLTAISYAPCIRFVGFRGVHCMSYGCTPDGEHIIRFPVPARRRDVSRIASLQNPTIDVNGVTISPTYTLPDAVFMIPDSNLVIVSSIVMHMYIHKDPTTSRDVLYAGVVSATQSGLKQSLIPFTNLRDVPVNNSLYGAVMSLRTLRTEYFR